MMVLIFGDKPSKRTDPDVPFKGAACEKRLYEWLEILEISHYALRNSCEIDSKTYGLLIASHRSGYPIIALGRIAYKRLRKLGYEPYLLPHPSGLNRQINDIEFIMNKLNDCKRWLKTFD